jgi:hypothetical protein
MRIPAYDNPNLHCWRLCSCAVLLAISADGQAQTADLIDHNGFETCWSQAISRPAFLSQLYSTIEGTTGCILSSSGSDPNMCYTSTCAGNVTGCPITLHAGVFTGDFATGSFDGPGSVDDFSTQVTYGGLTCTATISNATLAYEPTYSLPMDGNNGVYTAALDDPVQITGPPQPPFSSAADRFATRAPTFLGTSFYRSCETPYPTRLAPTCDRSPLASRCVRCRPERILLALAQRLFQIGD